MDWARIMAPLGGGHADTKVLEAAAAIAEGFGAELEAVYAPPDVSDLMPWMGDGAMGGVQPAALEGLREATAAGAAAARGAFEACAYGRKRFLSLDSPVWASLAMRGRLCDLVVFDDGSARGRGLLADCFQQIIADEQRPTLVAREVVQVGGVVAVAWDGGKEASRAMRTALPLLQKASRVLILHAPAASPRRSDPADLRAFLEARGVASDLEIIPGSGDPASNLIRAAKETGAGLLVAGAFGHPRLQEFIFGGSTRTFIQADAPSLFLSH